ncbi:MAG: formate dehydrogenase accessory sulfurtransferase FdhD [Bacteroidia bacterium]|nr:formate dehydrogenase accessory sulfurtransferase FdhD [Bacteroidia bacterium]
MQNNKGIKSFSISRINNGEKTAVQDDLAIEEPLEMSLETASGQVHKVSITMRTPGEDAALAAGFLFTEGIVNHPSDILQIKHTQTLPGIESNTILIQLSETATFNAEKLNRNFYTTSSCGVCGKASIDAIKTVGIYHKNAEELAVQSSIILQLPQKLRELQETFEKTGGLHASALFDIEGNLLGLKEDVGRHNALDKLLGTLFLNNLMPLHHHILLLSGRASFELLQKAAMAGIKVVCAVGAPSSLAVETAMDFGITLVGFLKENRFNIYSHPERIK